MCCVCVSFSPTDHVKTRHLQIPFRRMSHIKFSRFFLSFFLSFSFFYFNVLFIMSFNFCTVDNNSGSSSIAC